MQKIVVFVSYNHDQDSRWIERRYFDEMPLIPWLEHNLKAKGVEFWYDRKGLTAGDFFRIEIEGQIDRAHIALLLLSRGFMASEFISTVEFPRIFSRVQKGVMVCVPILTSPCPWKKLPLLSEIHVVPAKETPLINYAGMEAEYTDAREGILQELESQVDKLRASLQSETIEIDPIASSNETSDRQPQPREEKHAKLSDRDPKAVRRHRKRLAIIIGAFCLLAALVTLGLLAAHRSQDQGSLPITSQEIDVLRSQAYMLGAQFRSDPLSLPSKRQSVKPLAEEASSSPKYQQDAPDAVGIIYRLQAASIMLRTEAGTIETRLQDGLEWLRKALTADPTVSDFAALQKAEQTLTQYEEDTPEGRQLLASSILRIAMVEAPESQVQQRVDAVLRSIFPTSGPNGAASDPIVYRVTPKPTAGSEVSPKEDFDFLWNFGTGDFTVGNIVETLRISAQSNHPEKDVGGNPAFWPAGKGRTSVQVTISSKEMASFEWEVSKKEGVIIAKNGWANEVMQMIEKERAKEKNGASASPSLSSKP